MGNSQILMQNAEVAKPILEIFVKIKTCQEKVIKLFIRKPHNEDELENEPLI